MMEPEPENETHAAPAAAAAEAAEEGFPPSSSSPFSHEIRLAGISASRDCAAPPDDVPVLPFPAELDFATMKETRGGSIWGFLHGRVGLSLPGAEIVELRRFGCRSLWDRFRLQKAVVTRENGEDANTQLMFHATSDPSKITGTGYGENGNGFDPRLSNPRGAYGAGAYFAEHAAYPVSIYPRKANADGTFDVFVAEVIVGHEKDYGESRAQGLHRPPDRAPGRLFDSVSGTEGGIGTRHGKESFGRQTVVFDTDRSYPHFLMTIRLPAIVVAAESFASPASSAYFGRTWDDPKYYETMRAVECAGKLFVGARGSTKFHLACYDPATAQWSYSKSGGWLADAQGWAHEKHYKTVRMTSVGGKVYVTARGSRELHIKCFDAASATWEAVTYPSYFPDADQWGDPKYYETMRAVECAGKLFVGARGSTKFHLACYDPATAQWSYSKSGGWLADAQGWAHEKHYKTVRMTSVGGKVYVTARGSRELHIKCFDAETSGWVVGRVLPALNYFQMQTSGTTQNIMQRCTLSSVRISCLLGQGGQPRSTRSA